MLENVLNKKVRVGIAFGALATGNYTTPTSTMYWDGIIAAYDDNFIMFQDGNIVGIKYVQTIQVLEN